MKNLSGFTLVELLTLISIVAILAAIALPSFTASMKGNRDISQINSVLDGLTLARSEAITYGNPVTICAGNSNACTDVNWADGWIVFYNTLPPSASTSTIRVFPAISGGNSLTSADSAHTAFNSFTFNSAGMLSNTPNGSVTFKLCDSRGAGYARSIDLNITGRATVSTWLGADIYNNPLTCP